VKNKCSFDFLLSCFDGLDILKQDEKKTKFIERQVFLLTSDLLMWKNPYYGTFFKSFDILGNK